MYQNGGDWGWFGGRIVQQLIKAGLVEDAVAELTPIVDRVCRAGDFREWYGLHDQVTAAAVPSSVIILLQPPSTFGRCFNSDGERAPAK